MALVAQLTGVRASASGDGSTRGPDRVDVAAATASTARPVGYLVVEESGAVHTFGAAELPDLDVDSADRLVAVATPRGVHGAWGVTATGQVVETGSVPDLPSVETSALTGPDERLTAAAATPTGRGLWVFTSAGRIFALGDATPGEEMRGYDEVLSLDLEGAVVAAAPTPTGRGVWMAAADGGVFSVGDARFAGSVPDVIGRAPDRPVVGLVADPDGNGYWLAAEDGGVFAFEAPFVGSLPAVVPFEQLAAPINGILPYGDGYVLVARDGGVFLFSSQPFAGSAAGQVRTGVVGIAVLSEPSLPDPVLPGLPPPPPTRDELDAAVQAISDSAGAVDFSAEVDLVSARLGAASDALASLDAGSPATLIRDTLGQVGRAVDATETLLTIMEANPGTFGLSDADGQRFIDEARALIATIRAEIAEIEQLLPQPLSTVDVPSAAATPAATVDLGGEEWCGYNVGLFVYPRLPGSASFLLRFTSASSTGSGWQRAPSDLSEYAAWSPTEQRWYQLVSPAGWSPRPIGGALTLTMSNLFPGRRWYRPFVELWVWNPSRGEWGSYAPNGAWTSRTTFSKWAWLRAPSGALRAVCWEP